jgi:hypothetical protein
MRNLSKLTFILFSTVSIAFSEENQKPFIKEHKDHNHKIDITNATVYQHIKDYGAVYNTTHLFIEYDIDKTQLVFVNSSITFGDGITKKLDSLGYSVYSTADDLESYLKNINDTGRKYLLELYYQKDFGKFVFVGGLIDATSFIDTNNYANDEHIQFLNSAFVNNPIAVLPSYNLGVYLKYKINESNSLSTVVIDNSPERETSVIVEYEKLIENYSFQIFGFKTTKTDQSGIGISSDFTLNEKIGVFFRGGYTNSDYNIFVSGGFEKFKNIVDNDSIGFAVGFINGKNSLKNIYVSEIFYEINLDKHIALTLDIQYMKENKEDLILGTRFYFAY